MSDQRPRSRPLVGALVALAVVGIGAVLGVRSAYRTAPPEPERPIKYQPRVPIDLSGFATVAAQVEPWPPDAPSADIAAHWRELGPKCIERLEGRLAAEFKTDEDRLNAFIFLALMHLYDGQPGKAYGRLGEARALAEKDRSLAADHLYMVIYCQGVAALRRGETDNCVLCRGESSCILPLSPAAVHTHATGSRQAIQHFTEYLARFADDLGVKWLLNVAHMTLGEYPGGVDPAHLVPLDRWRQSEFDIGKFRDIGHLVGINRLNQAGGAAMDDFDNDGLLDVVCTAMDPTERMVFYRNKGDGTFEDRSEAAGLGDQYGGLNLTKADYDNDGHLDLFVVRGAWSELPMRPSLLRNKGDGTFVDVTRAAGLLDPVSSNAAIWADFDNDGFLDVFICCERQFNRLYRNRGNGTFEDVTGKAGVAGPGEVTKGATWIDFDSDTWPDLFVNNLNGTAYLYRNRGNGTFADATTELGIDGPKRGFSCWAFDYDNDGHQDIFATSYDRSLADGVKGLIGEAHERHANKLYRNLGGKGFKDVAAEAGLDLVFMTMGSNFGDFDNDGYLDFYLGTGEPDIATLLPNRMFKNVAGQRFAEITASSGTGQLQKGHGVACGDWDRDGDVDIFIEMGGATHGDKYHNILFQNPGQGNHWLTVKLVGKQSNRSAIGARIKVVTAGDRPQTVYRHVNSGSSFGGNPFQQTIGLGKVDRVATLEVYWPTSKTTQVFRDIPAGQAIEITELATDYRRLDWKPVPVPK